MCLNSLCLTNYLSHKSTAGVSVADLCRKHGVSDATVYKWKAKYGGM
ncbi:MAG: transposase, partial [Rhodobacteraceae bacterium]|nr:transposase [Paracoccaceae bacterium]